MKLTRDKNGSMTYTKGEESKENCNINTCVMEAKILKIIDDIKSSIRWTLGICVSALVGLLIWTATLRADQITNEEQLIKINNDYAPLMVIQDIFENNDKMIEIVSIISNSSKPDERYKEAIRSRDKFQRDALLKISATKRGSETAK